MPHEGSLYMAQAMARQNRQRNTARPEPDTKILAEAAVYFLFTILAGPAINAKYVVAFRDNIALKYLREESVCSRISSFFFAPTKSQINTQRLSNDFNSLKQDLDSDEWAQLFMGRLIQSYLLDKTNHSHSVCVVIAQFTCDFYFANYADMPKPPPYYERVSDGETLAEVAQIHSQTLYVS